MVTPRIWVSPRSNSAEPCTRGNTPTSAGSGRMSARPRPSMRTLSRSTRSRTSCLVSERNAAPISFSRPSNSAPSFSRPSALISSSRPRAPACRRSSARRRGRPWPRPRRRRARRPRSRGRPGTPGSAWRPASASSRLRLAQLLDERLGGVEAAGDDLLGRRLGAARGPGPRSLGGLGLDHHDRDVAGLGDPAGDDHVEDGSSSWRGSGTRPTGPRSGRRGRRRPGRRTAGRRAGWTATRR